MANILVIGGGFAGCIAGHILSEKGNKVTLVERSSRLGGSCVTDFYGGHPYTLGPRHFLAHKPGIFDFLDRFCPMKRYEGHEFLTYIERDQNFYHFPIHEDEVAEMPDAAQIHKELEACPGPEGAQNLKEYWQLSVGDTLYDKFVKSYSKKMWDIDSNTEITDFGFTPKGVALKSGPVKAAWTEADAGFPKAPDGYNQYFGISTQKCDVHLNTEITDFDVEKRRVEIDGEWHTFDRIISTISPEIILKNAFGELRWSGRDFMKVVLPVENVFPDDVYFLYYANDEPFTRIVEYKKFYENKSPTTLIGIEIPSKSNKLYPYPMKKDQDRAQQYFDALPEWVDSIGRAGRYRYLDVGMIIDDCMDLYGKI